VLEVNGKQISQSGAILVWLAETIGKFAPVDRDERIEALRWIESAFQQLMHGTGALRLCPAGSGHTS
jgi:glutathione S-transferase